ncbi:MAG: Smr/MutS family protein [Thermoanaerobaculales bacterium]
MIRRLLSDPKVRLAYVVTKIGVFAVAALATWPLARLLGPKAWIGLGIFGAVLVVMTIVVLIAGSTGGSRATESPETETPFAEDEPDADLVVEIPIEDSLDLHPFSPRDIPDVVSSFLEAAHAKGLTEVRLIHGRGIGVQRERVQNLLARHPLVDGFHDAPPERGGWGATITYLKTNKQ